MTLTQRIEASKARAAARKAAAAPAPAIVQVRYVAIGHDGGAVAVAAVAAVTARRITTQSHINLAII